MNAVSKSAPNASHRALDDPPGGVLLWLLVTLELSTFGMIFAGIAYLRRTQPAVFRSGQQALSSAGALLLTIALLTSGWLAAEAVHSFRERQRDRARKLFGAAFVVGLVFVALKIHDYASKVRAGIGLGVNDFWDAYLLATGFHFAHVLVGLVLLVLASIAVTKNELQDAETSVAGMALFWHLCDVAWFFLFPLFFARLS